MQKKHLFCAIVVFSSYFLATQCSLGWLKRMACCASNHSVMEEQEVRNSHSVALDDCISTVEVSKVDCHGNKSVIIFPPESLLQAVECGSISLVRALIAEGGDVNRGERGYTPLGIACHCKNYQMVQYLLKYANANPNGGGFGNWSPLMVAACNGATNVAHLLWSKGACVNDRSDIDGLSALHLACQRGHSGCVQFLLYAGAQVNQTNSRQETPLLSATIAKKKESVSLLLRAGADPTIVSSNQWTPLWIAAKNGCADIVQLLLDYGVSPDTVGPKGTSALNIAACKGYRTIVEMLCNVGADIEHRSESGATVLHCALKGRDLALAYWLVEHGADTNALYGEKSILDVLSGGNCSEQKSFVRQALKRGFSQYTTEQLATLAIKSNDAVIAKNNLHQAMSEFCFEGNDRQYFPRDLHFLVGSLVGGALAQSDARFSEPG